MELINLNSLNVTMEESKDIINYIAQKSGISTKILLSSIEPNLKCKNNKILTTKTHQNLTKTHQHLKKTQQKLTKTHQNLTKNPTKSNKNTKKINKNTKKSNKNKNATKITKLEKCKNTQNLTYEKP